MYQGTVVADALRHNFLSISSESAMYCVACKYFSLQSSRSESLKVLECVDICAFLL